ncbi:MAG: hypothetical protein ACOH5I_07735 [Oligoflexus sp.]
MLEKPVFWNGSLFLQALAKQKSRSLQINLIFSTLAIALAGPAQGFEVKGQFRAGGYSSQVKLLDDISGLGNNDASVISNRLNMNFYQFNQSQDEINLDFRDRYNFFGKADREILELKDENTFEARELAYRRPWQKHRLYFTAGRYIPKEAGLITNDGADVGYRLTRDHRIGAFAGIADQSLITPPSIQPDTRGYNGTQGGAYWVYDRSDSRRMDATYMTNAIAQAPTAELIEFVNKVQFYHLSLFQLGPQHRLSNHFNLDLAPDPKLRQAYISYHYYSPRYRLTSYYNRISPEENRILKEIQDDLVPSTVDMLSANLIQRLSSVLSLEYRLQLGRRAADGKQRQVLAVGSRYLGFLRGRMALGGLFGLRNNYQSSDQYIDLKLDFYQSKWSVHLEQGLANKAYEAGGPKLFETRTAGELAFYFGERLRGSAAFSQTKNEQVEVTTMFLMIGYYFGTGTTSPIRSISPIFEGI